MLKASNLSKSYDVEPLFVEVSFVLHPGDRVGLVGPNGVGKTTLLRVLAGREGGDTGSVQLGRDDVIGYLPQEVLSLDLTVQQYLRRSLGEVTDLEDELRTLEKRMAGGETEGRLMRDYGHLQDRFAALGGWSIDETIGEGRARLGIDDVATSTRLSTLSGGELARVAMAGALLLDPTILLLDEPTNHLDLEGMEWLEDFTANFNGIVLTISHDRRFLDRCFTRTVELDGVSQQLQSYEGDYSFYRAEKRRRWERWLLDFEAQEKHRKRLEQDIERMKRHAQSVESSTRNDQARRLAAKVAKKAKVRSGILARQAKMASWVARPESRPKITVEFNGTLEPGRRLLAMGPGAGMPALLGNLQLELRSRDRLAVVGPNGSGKTTLLRGALAALATRSDLRCGYLPQDHADYPLEVEVLQFFRSKVSVYEEDARTVLDQFLFEQHQLRQPLRLLSSGERTRLGLATLVCSGAECLVLDEPTNHLDFDSLDVVTDALQRYEGTLMVASHDRQFMSDLGLTELVALGTGDGAGEHWSSQLRAELLAR